MIDLDFLRIQSAESEDIMKQMIEIFIETAPDQIQKITKMADDNDGPGLMAATHAFLSSLKILNAEAAIILAEKIESHLKSKGEIKEVERDLNSFLIICRQLVEEAKELRI